MCCKSLHINLFAVTLSMSSARLRRVNREIADCASDPQSDVHVEMVDGASSLTQNLRFILSAPSQARRTRRTKMESSRWCVEYINQDIAVPEGYPFQPLSMRFITKVYHPNVSSQSGAICLDILKGE